MHGDVLGLAQSFDICERKLDRVLDESAHLQLEILEAVLGQTFPILAFGHLAVGPEVRRDILLGIVLLRNEAVQGEQLHRVGD